MYIILASIISVERTLKNNDYYEVDEALYIQFSFINTS